MDYFMFICYPDLTSITFIFFFFFLLYFTILYWFCHTLTWIHHRCIQAPNPESPSHLPPHIISLDHPHAPAPSIPYPVSNIDWRFVSYMIVYMLQCHCPKSSHTLPLPLPQSPKVRYTHLCLFCCPAYKVGWQHSYGRKWRRTKKPLDESQRGEWKSWLKAQYSEN